MWECGEVRDGGTQKERGCREGKDKGERMESLGADRPALQADTFLLSPGGLEPQ